MSRELYRTHTMNPSRGTLWEHPDTGRIYRITKTKWRGAVGIVYGKPATLQGEMEELQDALLALGRQLRDALPL
jgi:hypothetical protein